MLFLSVVLAMFGAASPLEPDVIICARDEAYTVELQARPAKMALFTEKRLEEYFRRFAEYPPERSVVITISADRQFVRELNTPRAGSSERQPTIRPTSGPQARFWKFGENAFLEFRDTSGQVRWKTLRGRNIYSTAVAGHEIFLVGEVFSCLGEGFKGPLSHQLIFVLPDLPDMADAEIAAICNFYRDQLPAAEGLEVSFYDAVDHVPVGFEVPTLEALKRGYRGSSASAGVPTRYAWYLRHLGRLSIRESSMSPVRELKVH